MKRNIILTSSFLILALVFLASSQSAQAFSWGAGLGGAAGVQVGHNTVNANGNATINSDEQNSGGMPPRPMMSHFFASSTWNGSGVFGTVTAVNGTTLTVSARSGFGPKASSTPSSVFTVDASNATVLKNGASSSVASIAVNDNVAVKGTVNGSSVTATTIYDGMFGPGRGNGNPHPAKPMPMPNSIIQGNGEPVVGGTVSAVSGNTITITTASGNLTYTIDASNAVVEKNKATSTASAINVGDKVVVQGNVSGNSVTASSIVDANASANASNGNGVNKILHSIGGFFQKLFGFF